MFGGQGGPAAVKRVLSPGIARNRTNKNSQNLSPLGRLTPWKLAPVWMYGGLRSGCMECAAAGGCLSPRAPQLCVHPGPQTGFTDLLIQG